jgi:uncharacterized membrane protein
MLKATIELLTILHSIIGAVCLVLGPIAMLAVKGGSLHRRIGKIVFYGILFISLTAIVTGYWHGRVYLVLVAFFAMYAVLGGYRSLYLKRLHQGQKPATIDKLLQGTALLVSLGLLIWGISMLTLKVGGGRGYVYLFFGLFGSFYAFMQYRRFFTNTTDKRQWLFDHMTGFIIGYLATLTAFSVNILSAQMPLILAWSWPSLIGFPILLFWFRNYRRHFANGKKLRKIAPVVRLGLKR